jgi:outer membrane lipoprotein carrier protein
MFGFVLAIAAMAVHPALTVDARVVVRALESRYHHAASLKATFFERYSDGNGGGSAESGTVYFSRPGRMRWEYESPEEKLFIVDGTNVWFYVPADHTASRAKIKDSSDWRTPLALLTGKTDFSRLCRTMTSRATGRSGLKIRCCGAFREMNPQTPTGKLAKF